MYLYNRNGVGFCWGHVSSIDLVHWRHHPDAIGPGDGDEGCFSGGGFVDDDGTAYVSYWMLWGDKGIGLAKSDDPHYDHWQKMEANPVIPSTEWGITETKDGNGRPLIYGSADPANVWKKDGKYYMLTGNLLVLNKYGRKEDAPLGFQGDRLYLFESSDLENWNYRAVFYERNPEWTDRSEDNMCPSFLPLPASAEGCKASGKYLLLFISHNKGCQYYVGDYDTENDRFCARQSRPDELGRQHVFRAGSIGGRSRPADHVGLADGQPGAGNRRKAGRACTGCRDRFWLGEDGTLRMRPVAELAMLRQHERTWGTIALKDEETKPLEGIVGDSCELEITVAPGTWGQCGVKVRAAPGGEEETLVYYDSNAKELVFDSTRSGIDGRRAVERAPFELREDEPLKLRVFVDKSVVEVYANDRQAICRRVYPGRKDSLGVVLFAGGGEAEISRCEGLGDDGVESVLVGIHTGIGGDAPRPSRASSLSADAVSSTLLSNRKPQITFRACGYLKDVQHGANVATTAREVVRKLNAAVCKCRNFLSLERTMDEVLMALICKPGAPLLEIDRQ